MINHLLSIVRLIIKKNELNKMKAKLTCIDVHAKIEFLESDK